jgi:hypothetical protein
MKRFLFASALAALVLPLAASFADEPQQLPSELKILPQPRFHHDFDISAIEKPAAVKTIPLWVGSDVTSGKGYRFVMVGQNPLVKPKNPVTNIPTVIVPVVIKIGAQTWDPTVTDGVCATTKSALTLTLLSPVIRPVTLKAGATALGTGQYTALFQRANFWKYSKPGGVSAGLTVNIYPVKTLAKVSYTPPTHGSQVAPCGGMLGAMDIEDFDPFIQNMLFKNLKASLTPSVLPIFLLYNVVMFDTNIANCCILGYHNSFRNPNYGNTFQTYSVSMIDMTGGAFTRPGDVSADVSALSHEIAEWMDDPTAVNPTPVWGHIGQVSGCQNNLEVGDPLSGTVHPIVLNGFTYHPQELAFKSWFYRDSPSVGVNFWFSLFGKFRTPSAPCS